MIYDNNNKLMNLSNWMKTLVPQHARFCDRLVTCSRQKKSYLIVLKSASHLRAERAKRLNLCIWWWWWLQTQLFIRFRHSNSKTKTHILRKMQLRFEIITAVTMDSAIFWDVAPCRSFSTSSTNTLVPYSASKCEPSKQLHSACLLPSWFTLLSRRRKQHIPTKRR
jgi:hypothetical protein